MTHPKDPEAERVAEEALLAVMERFPTWAPSAVMKGFARAVAKEAARTILKGAR